MKHLIIAINMILISSYLFATEFPRNKQLSRKPVFRKYNHTLPSIILHNKLDHYDISTEKEVIIPGESKKIHLRPGNDLELAVFVHALDNEIILKFDQPLPHSIYFTEKAKCIEVAYDETCLRKYTCK